MCLGPCRDIFSTGGRVVPRSYTTVSNVWIKSVKELAAHRSRQLWGTRLATLQQRRRSKAQGAQPCTARHLRGARRVAWEPRGTFVA